MDLTERKKQILKRVVEDYIAAAEPVGSKALAEEMGGSVSSATIRNELADLVEMGYLEQPHTSAGRVPSPKGYRLYVNELMEKREVSETEAEEINEQLKQVQRHGQRDRQGGADGVEHRQLPRVQRDRRTARGERQALRAHRGR